MYYRDLIVFIAGFSLFLAGKCLKIGLRPFGSLLQCNIGEEATLDQIDPLNNGGSFYGFELDILQYGLASISSLNLLKGNHRG